MTYDQPFGHFNFQIPITFCRSCTEAELTRVPARACCYISPILFAPVAKVGPPVRLLWLQGATKQTGGGGGLVTVPNYQLSTFSHF